MMNVPKNKLEEVIKILPEGKKPTIAKLTDPNWIDLTVVLEERLVREIAPDLKTIGVEDIVEYSINKIIQ
jgi:ATP phosphoribosyltransferase